MKIGYAAFQRQPTPLIPASVQHRPLAPLRVIGPNGDGFVHALLDTGADYCVLPKSLASHLGVILAPQPQTARGAGGHTIQVLPGSVDLEVSHGGEVFRWSTNVGFADNASPLLGHAGFFHYFRACFDPDARELELTPAPRFPGTVSCAIP